jgi:hypothetical protein
MNKLALIINTHSSNEECLELFFYCLEKYVDQNYFNNVYVFTDATNTTFPDYVTCINYNPKESFKQQMVHCLSSVEEPNLLYCNEDYLFYDSPQLDIADDLLYELDNSDFDFIKMVHTDIEPYEEYKSKLFIIDKSCTNNFSQTLSFWKTEKFLEIHKACPRSEIGEKGDVNGHLEVLAQDICRELNIKGLCYYNGEAKRGQVHFDTEVFPHVASALIRGQWNAEYQKEIQTIMTDYNKDCANVK